MPFTGDMAKLASLQVTVDILLMDGAPDIKINSGKLAEPPGVTKLSAPVAPEPTIAVIEVDERTWKEATAVPPSVIAEVPFKLVPVIVMTAPVLAAVGVKLIMVGEGGEVNTQAAPFDPSSVGPPIMAVFPSALIDTLPPC
jgi:hypothetical protein